MALASRFVRPSSTVDEILDQLVARYAPSKPSIDLSDIRFAPEGQLAYENSSECWPMYWPTVVAGWPVTRSTSSVARS